MSKENNKEGCIEAANNIDIKEAQETMKALGIVYRRAKARHDIYIMQHRGEKEPIQFEKETEIVSTIDRILQDCDPETRFIIRKAYLEKNVHECKNGLYSKSTYYRVRNKAILEFLDCLKI